MPKYSRSVSVPGYSAQDLYEKVESDIERFLEKSGVSGMDLQMLPDQKKVSVDSKMVTFELTCSDGELSLDGKLSLIAAPFKGKLDEGIDRWIAKTFPNKS